MMNDSAQNVNSAEAEKTGSRGKEGHLEAQLVEHVTLDVRVVSSSPTLGMEPTYLKN